MSHFTSALLAAALFAAAGSTLAATPNLPPPPSDAQTTAGGLAMVPAAGPALAVPQGFVSWMTLGRVTPQKQGAIFVPRFAQEVSALDGKEVKLQGFMMPLEMGEKQAHFILSATTPTCGFCMPGGPDQVVEIKAAAPVKYSTDAVSVSGKFVVLKNDPMGLYYRLDNAKPIPK